MKLTSIFAEGETIPKKHTCDGDNINPELHISDVPTGTQSLTLIVDDPDIPQTVKDNMNIEVFDHWIVFNIDPETTTIEENTIPGTPGKNSKGKPQYTGPCPPDREHRYFFKLYALDIELPLQEGCTKQDIEQEMQGHILAETTLIGRYERT